MKTYQLRTVNHVTGQEKNFKVITSNISNTILMLLLEQDLIVYKYYEK